MSEHQRQQLFIRWHPRCTEHPGMTKLPYLWLALLPGVGSAQQFLIGFLGGVPAEPSVGKSANSLPFVLGPTLSMGLSGGLSLETGVLFHRLGSTRENYAVSSSAGAFILGTDEWKGRAIEIPLLLKYHFLSRSSTWRPFVSAGPTVRWTSIDYNGSRSILSSTVPATSSEPMRASETTKWNVDPVLGVGVSFRTGRVRIEPEVRYSYWGAGKHEVIRQNQVHFLFGLRF